MVISDYLSLYEIAGPKYRSEENKKKLMIIHEHLENKVKRADTQEFKTNMLISRSKEEELARIKMSLSEGNR